MSGLAVAKVLALTKPLATERRGAAREAMLRVWDKAPAKGDSRRRKVQSPTRGIRTTWPTYQFKVAAVRFIKS